MLRLPKLFRGKVVVFPLFVELVARRARSQAYACQTPPSPEFLVFGVVAPFLPSAVVTFLPGFQCAGSYKLVTRDLSTENRFQHMFARVHPSFFFPCSGLAACEGPSLRSDRWDKQGAAKETDAAQGAASRTRPHERGPRRLERAPSPGGTTRSLRSGAQKEGSGVRSETENARWAAKARSPHQGTRLILEPRNGSFWNLAHFGTQTKRKLSGTAA